MAAPSKRSLHLRKIVFVSLLTLIAISIAVAVYQNREWKVPEEAKRLKNPIPFSGTALQAGRRVYLDKCAECHGDSGKGDGPQAAMYSPAPASLADAKRMASVTDGEIFYQISEGRKPMPAFKKRLTEAQRWQLVLFVRSFVAPEQPSSEPASKAIAPSNP